MEAAMANATSAVSSVIVIIISAFLIGYIGVGIYVKRSGGSAKLAQLSSSLVTIVIILGGVLLYVRG
jgi:hypothetical protein